MNGMKKNGSCYHGSLPGLFFHYPVQALGWGTSSWLGRVGASPGGQVGVQPPGVRPGRHSRDLPVSHHLLQVRLQPVPLLVGSLPSCFFIYMSQCPEDGMVTQ